MATKNTKGNNTIPADFEQVQEYTPFIVFEDAGDAFHGRVKSIVNVTDPKSGKESRAIKMEGIADGSTCYAGNASQKDTIEDGKLYQLGGAAGDKYADNVVEGMEVYIQFAGKVKSRTGNTVNDIKLYIKK